MSTKIKSKRSDQDESWITHPGQKEVELEAISNVSD